MSGSSHVIEVTDANFSQIVVEGSSKVPVLVDFWANWCAPCRSLMPVLAKLAGEYSGQFIVAKVNTDEQQELAAQFGVRSLPTVKLFKDGQPVDEFMGALPEGQVREFIDRYVERESERLLSRAAGLLDAGKCEEAGVILQKAYELDPYHLPVVREFIELLSRQGRLDDVDDILNALPGDIKDNDEVRQMLSRQHFARLSQNGDAPAVLQQRIEDNPADCDAREKLANHYVALGQYEQGMEQFLEIMKRDRGYNDDAGRKGLLQTFQMIGGGKLVSQYRKRMSSLML